MQGIHNPVIIQASGQSSAEKSKRQYADMVNQDCVQIHDDACQVELESYHQASVKNKHLLCKWIHLRPKRNKTHNSHEHDFLLLKNRNLHNNTGHELGRYTIKAKQQNWFVAIS